MEQVKVEYFKGGLELVGLGMQAGASANPLNVDVALRDALRGTGMPAKWRKTQAQAIAKQKQQAMQMLSQVAAVVHMAGQAGDKLGDAGQKLGLLPPADYVIKRPVANGQTAILKMHQHV